jgi:hypothetical protein
MGRQDSCLVSALNELQKRILDLFGFSHNIYLDLVTNFQNSRTRDIGSGGVC